VSTVKKLGKVAVFPLWKRVRWRIENVTDQRFAPQFEDLRHQLEGLRGELDAAQDELREESRGHTDRRADDLDGRFRWHDDELRRIAAHVAAMDSRIASLERPGPGDGQATPEIEEVRAEHARIRARVSVVAQYEERLARVEEALAHRVSGD
jgi:chromosome segregation ATPase